MHQNQATTPFHFKGRGAGKRKILIKIAAPCTLFVKELKMALDKTALCLRVVSIGLIAPALCLPAAISINGVCKSGDCSHPGILFVPSGNAKAFLFTYTFANTDTYSVHGSYSTSNTSDGTSVVFTVVASYLGNLRNTPSGDDTLNVDLFQDYNCISSPNGTYSYSSSATLGPTFGAGSYFDTNLFYDGQNVGEIGPFTGVGETQRLGVGDA